MNKELVIKKPECPKCKKSSWKTVKKGVKVQCRLCGEVADYVKVEPICKVIEQPKVEKVEEAPKDAVVSTDTTPSIVENASVAQIASA